MVEARDFTQDEISEINQYISANVPYSILQTLFPLTENSQQKAQIFTIVYRILNSSKNYVEDSQTREKLIQFLSDSEDVYLEVYKLLSLLDASKMDYGKHLLDYKLRSVFTDSKKNSKINKLIDLFLIFSEKLVLLETNKVAGLEMDVEEGREFYKKIVSGDTKNNLDNSIII